MNIESPKVICVVVTYNRLNLLKRCIEHLRMQTRSLDKILIINNSSTDGTIEWIDAQSDLTVITQPNNGGAGGFKTGMIEAFNMDFDWIWLMDDDGYADKSCLENLLKQSSNNIQYLAPNLIDDSGNSHFYKYYDTSRSVIWHSGGPFNGILLGRHIIEIVGYPLEDFFIWGDEYEFLNRIIGAGYVTVLVPNAIFHHKSTSVNYKTANRYFYMTRNMIWRSRLAHSNWILGKKMMRLQPLYSAIIVLVKLCLNRNFKGLKEASKGFIHGFKCLPQK